MRIMSRPRALVAAVAACLLLAGCGSGPSQVRAAFLLGDTEVSQDTVQQLIDKAVREQPAAQQLSQQHKLDQLGREIVGQLAQHELLVKAARQEGLVADEATVSGLLGEDPLVTPVSANGVDPSQLARQIAYRARDHREVFTDYGLMQALGRKHFGGLSVTYDYTVVTSDDGGAQPQSMRDKAFAKAERMAASPAAADQVLREDAAAGVQTGSGQQISAVQSPAAASTVLFGCRRARSSRSSRASRTPRGWWRSSASATRACRRRRSSRQSRRRTSWCPPVCGCCSPTRSSCGSTRVTVCGTRWRWRWRPAPPRAPVSSLQ